jgi:hypothetical protein
MAKIFFRIAAKDLAFMTADGTFHYGFRPRWGGSSY